MAASKSFYREFLASDLSLEELAERRGIKCSTASTYVSNSYDSRDATRMLAKLGLDAATVKRAFKVMVSTQEYRQQYPTVKSADLTRYIHEALGNRCTNCCLATSIIRRLFVDVCKQTPGCKGYPE